MDMNEAQAWTVIVVGLGTALVGIVTAWRVQVVHKIVNSAATAAETEIRVLRSILAAKQIEISTAEQTRKDLAQAIVTQTRVAEASERTERTAAHATAAQASLFIPPVVAPAPIPVAVVLTDTEGTPIPTPIEVSVADIKDPKDRRP